MKKPDEKFISDVVDTLDRSLESLDPETLERLSRLKYRAIDTPLRGGRWQKTGWIFTATAALLFLFVLSPVLNRDAGIPSVTESVDLRILTTTEPFEFYAEDVEFYQWLSELMEKNPELFEQDSVDDRSAGPAGHSAGTGASEGDATQPGIA